MLSRDEIRNQLEGVRFPTDRREVVDRLREAPNAKPEFLRLVKALPEMTYRKPADVVHALDFTRTKAPYTRSGGPERAPGDTR